MPRQLALVPLALAAQLLLAGCRVEQTPDEYFDRGSIEAERAASGGEVRDRLLAFVGSAARGDAAQALISLHPADGVDLVGPAGLEVSGGEAIRALVTTMITTPVSVRVREIEVEARSGGVTRVDIEAAPLGGVAWFRMVIEAPGTTAEPSLYQATGTYVRDGGLWELVQAHVAGPLTTDSSSSNPPDSAATPEEGE